MGRRRMTFVWLGACACWLAAATAPGFAQTAGEGASDDPRRGTESADLSSAYAPSSLDLDGLPPDAQRRVRAVIDQPTLAAHGPLEIFTCQPKTYH